MRASSRRFVPLALATLALLGLAACGQKKASGPQEIVLWVQMDPAERARLDSTLADYGRAHPELKLSYVSYDTENLRQQFQTAAAGGAGPQIIFGPSDQVGPLSLLQLIQPLDETLPAGFFDRFVPQALDTLNGHLWAAPDQVGNHLMLCHNRALVPTPPATHDEFLAIAKAQSRAGRYGFSMNVSEPYWLAPFLGGFGGWVMDAEGNPTLDSPGMVQALEYLAGLKNREGVMPKEANYENSETLFKEGKVAMIVNGPWSWAGYREAGIDLGIAPLWTLPNGQRASPMTASKGYSINVNVKKDELPAVIALVEHLTSPAATLRDATRLGILPSHRDAWNDPAIQADPMLKGSQEGYAFGRRMPVRPEMRVMWDVMRPGLQSVMNGSVAPDAAARQMQAEAVKQIAGMKQ
jgi:maltose-binding protein MalE